jgi:phosphoglycerol transferase
VTAKQARHKPLLVYGAACVLSVLCVWIVCGYWRVDLRFPLVPLGGEALLTQAVVFKGLVDNAWVLHNKMLGAPFGMNLRDCPHADLLVLAVTKLMASFTKDHVLIRNLIAIASFPLVTVTSLFVMRRLRIRDSVALVASLLYAFISFHHAQLGADVLVAVGYFTVPIATLLALLLFENEPLLVTRHATGLKWQRDRNTLFIGGACLLIGLTGSVLFPVFSCFILAVAAVFAALLHRSKLPAIRGALMIVLVAVALGANLFPSIWYRWQHGRPAVIRLGPEAAESYGLKIAQLLIPGTGHRLPALQRLSDWYARVAPCVTENRTAYLGVIGAAGFLYLLYVLMRGEPRDGRVRSLSILNLAALLLGTVGGFSSLIAFLGLARFHHYHRLSVYIAFFSLLALALLAEKAALRWITTTRRRSVMGVALTSLLCLGLVDESRAAVDYDALKKQYAEQAQFVRTIEASVPRNSRIFQLPSLAFPQLGAVEKLEDNAELLPYLQSNSLRWSYGAKRGTSGAEWSEKLASMPIDQLVDNLAYAGFSGIYVERLGYPDRAERLESSLKTVLGKPTIADPRSAAAFYSLGARAQTLRAAAGDKEFERRAAELISPLFLGWLDGFYPPEAAAGVPRVWCQSKCRLVINNPSRRAVHVVLEAKLHAASVPARVWFESDLFNRKMVLGLRSHELSEGFDVPPGEHHIKVRVDGSRKPDVAERDLYLAFDDPHFSSVVR